MVKTHTAITFFLIIGLSAFHFIGISQSQIGVDVGLNLCKLSGDAPQNAVYKNNPGLVIGVSYDIHVSKSVLIGLQPSYSQEGTKVFYNVPNVDTLVDSIDLRLNYFSIPILIKVLTAKERFYAVGGIETSFLLNGFTNIDDQKDEITSNVTTWNLAMIFGVGYRIPIGSTRLVVEGRYSQGLVNLTEESIQKDLIPRVKTSGIKLLVGFEIPLSKKQ